MKAIKFIIIFLLIIVKSNTQDIINCYDPENIDGVYAGQSITPFDGEYQIYIDFLYWNNLTFFGNFISYSFECVSFPFIPECFPSCIGTDTVRKFITISDFDIEPEGFDNIQIDNYFASGKGWRDLASSLPIFRQTEPLSFSGSPGNLWISRTTALLSIAYVGIPQMTSTLRLLLPHSIIKINLNVHDGISIDDPIAMQISWLYDNTRGRMRNYPFINHNGGVTGDKRYYDVIFKPKFHYSGYPDNTNHTYLEDSNSDWFSGAFPQDISLNPTGSINYYHSTDLGQYIYSPFYPSPNGLSLYFPSEHFYYPAPYSLLSPTLADVTGNYYAGYPLSGSSPVEWGIEHKYKISESIDLNNINPTEKIIYNPSVVTIDANITFPAGYKFLTIHGKYPDKSWVEYNNINNYEDLRDVLCPSDQVGINGEFLSEYIISSGKSLTIKESVIIMDSKFSGFGTIKYNPYKVYGNFKIGENGPVKFYKIESDLTITQGQHYAWENDVELLAGKLTIENGASLTIHENVYISPTTKIVVERGGKLVLDGGTLTGLDSEMWRGIEVWGNPTLSSTESNQGSVFVINGGTIENAIVGIRTAKTVQDEESETIDLSFSGGIVKVSDGRFVNNRTAIYFYKYPAAGYSHQYSGIIMNNTSFETNDDYDGSTFPWYFIYMNDISRVTLTACTFWDNTSQQIKQSGIYSFNSQFIIKGSTSGGSGYNSNFKKLNYGVYALASTPNRFPDIRQTGFEDNKKGIYFSGISHAQVNYCNFTTSTGQTGIYGLYLDGCRNYWVEGNEFSNVGTDDLTGIVVNDTRPTGPEMIYRNFFTDMHVGIMALNRNRTRSGEGLVLKCNEYVNTYWNQVINIEGIFTTPEMGIAINQGSPDNLTDAPAGNRFSQIGPTGTPTDINNQTNHITYYHHVASSIYQLEPEHVTESTVNVVPNPDAPWLPEQICPSHLDPGGGGSGGGGLVDSGEFRLLIASSGQQADSVGQLIQALEDAGDTQGLKWTVDMSAPNQAYEVYNQLMNAAPYVSDTVMAAAIQKESVMVDAMIRDVMVANPESAKDDHLLELLGERFNPLPEYMLGQILQGRSLVSVYGELKSKQAYWMQQRSLAMNMLKAYYLADTVNPEASLDTLAMLLAEENTADARYQLAMLHAERHDWSGAMAVLNAIPQYFTLDQDGLQSHQDMVSLMGLLQQMDGSLPNSAQAAALFALLGQENGKAPVYARNILIAAGLLAYEEPLIYPDPYKSSKEIEFERLVKLAGEHRMIEVFPNPAGSYFIVKWEVERPANHMEVRLTSSTGQAVMQIQVSGSENQQIVPTQGIKAGVYVVSLHVGGKTLDSVKITIVH